MEKTPSCRVFIKRCYYITEPFETVCPYDLGDFLKIDKPEGIMQKGELP